MKSICSIAVVALTLIALISYESNTKNTALTTPNGKIQLCYVLNKTDLPGANVPSENSKITDTSRIGFEIKKILYFQESLRLATIKTI